MEERRRSQRWETAEYQKLKKDGTFNVIDISNGRSIGHLADISADGMRIISGNAPDQGQVYKLRIDLPEEICGCDQLNVDAKNVWCREDTANNQFQTGFEFLHTFPHHEEIIEMLFRDLVQPVYPD